MSLPFTLAQTEPDPAAERAARERRAARSPSRQGRGFGRLTVLPRIIVVAWLLTGLPLLLAGEFLPVPMLLISAPLATALGVNVLQRIPGRWPAELPGKGRDRGWTAAFGLVGTVAIAAGFVAWQLARNSPSLIASRTPGAYFQTGYWIAQHGSLPITGSLAAFGGAHAGLHLSSVGFVAHGHSVVPAVTAGLPMLLAGGFWTSGTGGGHGDRPGARRPGVPVVRRPGRPAGRPPVGAGRGARARADHAGAVHQPGRLHRDRRSGAAVRRVVPADRRADRQQHRRVPARAAVAGRPRQSSACLGGPAR